MSDKKQPAQQRVNVRIVKADNPEQRSGIKAIAKADGSLQISPEEACGRHLDKTAVRPPRAFQDGG